MTIRRQPEDFIVEELLADASRASLRPAWHPDARHGLYELTKSTRTTPEAVAELAKALKLRPGLLEYAGLKDKHARTTQHVSARFDRSPSAEDVGTVGEVSGRQWSAKLLGWAAGPITAQAIEGNRFTIIVRGLARETCAEMNRRARLLAEHAPSDEHPGPSLLFVNYFGAQRFGSARHGQGFIATSLIRGDFEQALKLAIATPARKDAGRTRLFTRAAARHWGDWQRLAAELPRCPERAPIEVLAATGDAREAFAALPYFLQAMYVEAFQSHLWNRAAHRLAARIAGGPERCLRSDDEFGEMLFPPAAAILDRATADWPALNMPVLARGTVLAEPWAAAARGALADEGLELDALKIPGLRRPFFGEADRPLVVEAQRFDMTRPEADDMDASGKRGKRTISFELPRGAYATVVLRALGQ